MTKYVFDSYAILVLFREENGYEEVIDLLTLISSGKAEGYICSVNIGEVYYITERKQNISNAKTALDSIKKLNLNIVDADLSLCIEAAKIKAVNIMSYADAFAAALAKSQNAHLVTGDKEFKQFEKDVKIHWLK